MVSGAAVGAPLRVPTSRCPRVLAHEAQHPTSLPEPWHGTVWEGAFHEALDEGAELSVSEAAGRIFDSNRAEAIGGACNGARSDQSGGGARGDGWTDGERHGGMPPTDRSGECRGESVPPLIETKDPSEQASIDGVWPRCGGEEGVAAAPGGNESVKGSMRNPPGSGAFASDAHGDSSTQPSRGGSSGASSSCKNSRSSTTISNFPSVSDDESPSVWQHHSGTIRAPDGVDPRTTG